MVLVCSGTPSSERDLDVTNPFRTAVGLTQIVHIEGIKGNLQKGLLSDAEFENHLLSRYSHIVALQLVQLLVAKRIAHITGTHHGLIYRVRMPDALMRWLILVRTTFFFLFSQSIRRQGSGAYSYGVKNVFFPMSAQALHTEAKTLRVNNATDEACSLSAGVHPTALS